MKVLGGSTLIVKFIMPMRIYLQFHVLIVMVLAKSPPVFPFPPLLPVFTLPPELLTELREQIEEIICKKFVVPQALKQKFSDMQSAEKQYYLDIAESVLLKCHQSESAEIASLQADIEELNILSRCNSEVYEKDSRNWKYRMNNCELVT